MFDSTEDYSDIHTQQLTLNMPLRGSSNLLPQAIKHNQGTSWLKRMVSAKEDLAEKMIALTEDKWPEANLLIGFR